MFNFNDIKIKKNYRGFVILILIIVIIIYLYFSNKFYRLFFFKRIENYYNYFYDIPHPATESVDLKYKLNKRIEKGHNSYSITAFLYIKNWKYKYFQIKHILDKGDNSPSIYLDKVVNNLVFDIKTEKKTQKFKILNVNINKWVHFGLVVQNLQVELYYNGKLYSSHILDSLPLINNDNLIICKDNGYDGLIYNVYLYDKALTHLQLEKMSSINPPISKKYFKDKY